MKKLILAWISSFLVMFLLAGLFNGLIISEFVKARVSQSFIRASQNLPLIALGYGVLSFLMAVIYPRVVSHSKISWVSGIIFGMVAGIAWLLPYSLVLRGVYEFPAIALIIDPAWALIEQGAGGLVIGLVYRSHG